MKCNDCGNKNHFYELYNGRHRLEYDDSGELIFTETGEDFLEDFMCVECESTDVDDEL